MYPYFPTLLLISGAMLLMSAGVMTLFGSSRPVYRGYWSWVSAQWLVALGVFASAFTETYPPLLVLSSLLTLQWPIVVLLGLRRFYARHPLRIPPAVDGVMITAAYLIWFGTWVVFGDKLEQSATFGLGAAVLHFYTAFMMLGLREFKQNSALQLLALALLTGGAVQMLRAVDFAQHGLLTWGTQHALASTIAAVLVALAMLYLSLFLTHERTELRLRFSKRRLRYLADIDTLTKVPNRRRFHELSSKVLSNGSMDSALLMFDIDHFKRINDTLGHAVGDEALRQVGNCTRDTLRELDVAGRLGGDEFAVLLPDTKVEEAMTVAARIVSRLEHRQVAPRIARLSLSFGVVQMHDNEPITDALRRADQALYEAKRQGRSRAVIAMGGEERPIFSRSQPMGLAT
jgi:diguanylate cyclase (GGDEF)-like protein